MALSQPQWQSENKYRVRLFKDDIHLSEISRLSQKEIFWRVADEFAKTDQAQWVDANSIKLNYSVDNNVTSWHSHVLFYADLNEQQYVDYTLRFFKHLEEWK